MPSQQECYSTGEKENDMPILFEAVVAFTFGVILVLRAQRTKRVALWIISGVFALLTLLFLGFFFFLPEVHTLSYTFQPADIWKVILYLVFVAAGIFDEIQARRAKMP
jgi:hypothetical protein